MSEAGWHLRKRQSSEEKRDPGHIVWKGGSTAKSRFYKHRRLNKYYKIEIYLHSLEEKEMMGLEESWTGLQKYEIREYKCFIKGRCNITRYGKNPGGLMACVKNIIDQYVGEIVTDM